MSEELGKRAQQLGEWFAQYAEHHRAKAEAIEALPGSEAWAKVERNLERARFAYTLQDDLAALKDRDVVLEEAAERAAFVAGYRAAHMVPDAYDSTSAAEEAWEGYRLVSRNLKERV